MSVPALASAGSMAADGVLSLAGGSLKAAGKAEAVAKDFESLFLGQLLKQMRQTLGPGGMFGSDSADVFGGLFDFFMGKHLADSGGMGIASAIKSQIQSTARDEPAPPR